MVQGEEGVRLAAAERGPELEDPITCLAAQDAKHVSEQVLQGEYLDPQRGRQVEGRRISTLWGELAFQLGGWDATGRMPKDMGGLGDLMGMRELASDMVAVVHAFKRGEASADDVEQTFTRALGLGRRQELPAGS